MSPFTAATSDWLPSATAPTTLLVAHSRWMISSWPIADSAAAAMCR